MKIRVGFELAYEFVAPTPMVLMLNVHPSRASDLIKPDHLRIAPTLPMTRYVDAFGNICTRLLAPKGELQISADSLVADTGLPDAVDPAARQHEVAELPHDTLVFLLGSRYCETDQLMNDAWSLFGKTAPGWARVQAICDFVHNHIAFGYEYSRSTKSAFEAFNEGKGVCRDYTHLAIAFCRCMNIPARYCTGYLGEIGVLPPYGPMDFAAWIEAYLGGCWCIFDPRNNVPRIGRVLIARGRDAADVAISNTFGPNTLLSFKVWTDEISGVGTP